MQRVVWIIVLVGFGLMLVFCGLLVPAHLRAVDAAVIEQAGVGTRSLIEEGYSLLSLEKEGPARLFWQVAQAEKAAGHEKLGLALTNFTDSHPGLALWGGADPYLERLFPKEASTPRAVFQPISDFVERPENRERLREFLQASPRPSVRDILHTRLLTNTVLFPPATFPSGQALDGVILLTGLLLQEDQLAPALQGEIVRLAEQANRHGDPQQLEPVFLDLLSLGKRYNWAQYTMFLRPIEAVPTLHHLAELVRKHDSQRAALFTAVHFSGQPAAVAGYLREFSETGLADVRFGLRAGLGGVRTLLTRKQRIYYPDFRQQVVQYDPFYTFFYALLGWCRLALWAALGLKYFFFLGGGFLLARAYQLAKFAVATPEHPLPGPGLAAAYQGLQALCFLLVILFLNEPYLAQDSQPPELPLRLELPMVGSAVLAGTAHAITPIMNTLAVFSLLLFFVLQALIYTACLIKVAEIRRQKAEPRLKLRLLDNEEHLFDAGLYFGFVGTIISLILMSMGIVKPSLMAGYSSTSFGIIFVSILKIFHVRPLRRKLILESESLAP